MSHANKSVILFFGVVAFFGLMVLGPVLGNLLDGLVSWGAEQSTHTTPTIVEKTREYASNGLAKAHECCVGPCGTTWDYTRDLCDPGSQHANDCLVKCVEAPAEAPKPAAHH